VEELPPEPIPGIPVEQPVPKPRKAKAPPSAPRVEPKKAAPKRAATKRTNLKDRHTCGACGQEMSLHTALYGHKNCPGKVDMPQPPALGQVAPEEPPQLTQAQALRLQLAQAAQERRAQAHLRMVGPIRSFYGL
ncbi:MAG: hypothetical protein VXZ35_08990, partial [Pseudomonadota bacterium]|nr:hypothetical protein [Pseudomonadota bacterium]